jgi:Protein of unknown function (DUF3489)
MSIKLTDTQLVVMSAAARREDRCLAMPDRLKGGAALKLGEKLIALGLAREIKAKPGTAIWRRDEEAGRSFALKLTAAGLSAIAAEAEADEDTEPSAMAAATHAAEPAPGLDALRMAARAASTRSAPREGTKLARVIGLLIRSHGVTLAELIATTDWLPHTTRAALTGLRKRGYAVTLDRSDKARGAAYLIAADAPLGSAATIHGATTSGLARGSATAAAMTAASASMTARSKRRVRRTEHDAARLISTGPAA